MRYGHSITDEPAFRKIVLIIGFFLFCAMYVSFETGGIIGSISAGLQGTYNILNGFIFVTYLSMILAWIFDKWEILTAIGIPIALFVWSFVYHKRR